MTARQVRRWRGALRAGQAVCLAWILVEVVSIVLASPAAADHCAAFTDCFNQANSAAEAAFGLVLLAGLSLVLDMLPVVGDVKGVLEAGIGRDILTGEELAPWERALGLIPLIPFTDVARGARHLDELSGVPRRGGGPQDVGRHLDDIGPGPGGRHLIDEYGDDATTSVRRREISEQLGTAGGQRYLQDATGRPDLGTIRPHADSDVAGYEQMIIDGEAWPHAVEFGGSRATNLVYFDGETMHIVEAKGGSSAYGERVSRFVDPGNPISQTHPDYPLDVANDMANSSMADGRNEVGRAIMRAYRRDQVSYVGVRTGGRDELLAGEPTMVLEHVFREPGP